MGIHIASTFSVKLRGKHGEQAAANRSSFEGSLSSLPSSSLALSFISSSSSVKFGTARSKPSSTGRGSLVGQRWLLFLNSFLCVLATASF